MRLPSDATADTPERSLIELEPLRATTDAYGQRGSLGSQDGQVRHAATDLDRYHAMRIAQLEHHVLRAAADAERPQASATQVGAQLLDAAADVHHPGQRL